MFQAIKLLYIYGGQLSVYQYIKILTCVCVCVCLCLTEVGCSWGGTGL